MNKSELDRVISDFEREASEYHDLRFRKFLLFEGSPHANEVFESPHHAINLWDFFGVVSDENIDQLVDGLGDIHSIFGYMSSLVKCMAVIEGENCKKFVAMAQRAASLLNPEFQEWMGNAIFENVLSCFQAYSKEREGKPCVICNPNGLSTWLNFLLIHLSLSRVVTNGQISINPDLNTLSLRALEYIRDLEFQSEKKYKPVHEGLPIDIDEHNFRVALSFAGENRGSIEKLLPGLFEKLGADSVFYDYNYVAQLARPNLDTLLQDIYRHRCDLVVVFLCENYESKEWCGLELRAVREMIKARLDRKIMFVKLGDFHIGGIFEIDGYLSANQLSDKEIVDAIVERTQVLSETQS